MALVTKHPSASERLRVRVYKGLASLHVALGTADPGGLRGKRATPGRIRVRTVLTALVVLLVLALGLGVGIGLAVTAVAELLTTTVEGALIP